METVEGGTINEEKEEEFRVQISSKKEVSETIKRYKDLLKTVLDGQTEINEKTKGVLLQELLENFEAAVQLNVLVNGQTWEEAPDVKEDEAVDVESLLDETIVETTRRRRVFPKKILPHVVHALKAERKIMGLYEKTVQPQEVLRDPEQGKFLLFLKSIMKDLSAGAPAMVKQAIQIIKSINTLQKQAKGLCQILNTKPSQESVEIHRAVMNLDSRLEALPPPVKGATRSREPKKRAAEKAVASGGYVPHAKKQERCIRDEEPA
ncbi:kinetochore-associated protein NSL1 homolog isoform 2-T2 [Pholidichthys leucotaenia]